MAQKKFPQSELPIRKTEELLPQIFQTESNKKFMSGVVDPFVQPGTLERTVGYIGRRYGKTFKGNNNYLDSDDTLRSRYQLEPGITLRNDENIEKFYDYLDFRNQLQFFGNNNEQDNKTTEQEHYSWNPPIDWDKLINYREYYWAPLGPPTISIRGQRQAITSTYRVKQGFGSTWVFTPDGFTNNPNIKLYRGQTYNFIVNSPGEAFTIRTNYDTGSLGFDPSINYSAGELAVFDGKLWRALRDISPADGSTIDVDSQDWELLDLNATAASFDYNTGIENNGTENGTITFTVPLDAPDILFYQSSRDQNRLGRFVISDVEDNTFVDVEKEILGKTSYNSSNGIELSNGMIIEFLGDVFPEKYATGSWLVEGTGTAISLTLFETLVPPNLDSQDPEVLFDAQGFDTQPFDDADAFPGTKDYITIKRDSNDLNPWSRYNRWFHRSVLEYSYRLRGQDFSADESARAKRPIIEFKSNIKLLNHGETAKPVVDYIDNFTSDIFSNIEGQGGYNIDGELVFDGARILFTNDSDTAANNKIYEIQFITHNNKRQIHLVETDDSTSNVNDVVFVRRGKTNIGKMFWYDGVQWKESQQKTTVNQSPKFDVYDENLTSFSDQTQYPVSSFTGSKIFSYKQGVGPNDAELGFPISYLNINNIGDIEFNWNYEIDNFSYSLDNNKFFTNINTGYYKVGSEYVNGWIKTNRKFIQPIIDSVIVTQETNTVEFKSVQWEEFDLDPNRKIIFFLNGEKITNPTRNGDSFSFDQTFSIDDVVSLKLVADVAPEFGYYQIPVDLEKNPLNGNITSLTLGQAADHVSSALEFDDRFNSDTVLGSTNLRDLDDYIENANRFMKHSGISAFSIFTLCDKDLNLIKSLEYAKDEYAKYKANLVKKAAELPFDENIQDFLDEVINDLASIKTSSSPFAGSDMLGSGAYTSIKLTVEDSGINTFALNENFNLNTLSSKAVYVYVNNTHLLNQKDYEFDDTFGFITISADLARGDQIEIREYVNTGVNFIPPTPTSLGLYKKYTPQKYLDDTFIEPKMVIQGHDGSITTAYNDFRDDLLLEFEYRIYNNIKQEYDENVFNIDDQFSGYYYKEGFSKETVDSVILKQFLNWASDSNLNYANNSYFDSQNSFTYTYSNMIDYASVENIPGWWRGVYRYVYDTDRPHTHPWEILGFSEKPTWWEDEYGPAPYTRNNLVLWDDIKNGIIRKGERAGFYDRYARATILNHIPVDDTGNLLSPLDSGFAKNFTLVNNQGGFALGDVSPVESAWRRSSEYPFALVIALALLKPFDFIPRSLDRTLTKRNRLDQVVYTETNVFPVLSNFNIPVVGQKQTAGLINYIVDNLKNFGKDTTQLQNTINNLDVNLSTRLSGFVDKLQQKYLLDSKSPSSVSSSIFIPPEDYEIYFNVSSPIESLSYSGVIIEKSAGGWTVSGYNSLQTYFEYFEPVTSQKDPIISVGGVSDNFVQWSSNQRYNNGQVVLYKNIYYRALQSHTSSENFDSTLYSKLPQLPITGAVEAFYRRKFNTRSVERLTYGTLLPNIQSVVDFLLGYQARLQNQGFVFDGYDPENQVAQDFLTSCKEFMFWTRHNWEQGSLITLSPASQELKCIREIGVVDNLLDSFYSYSIYKSNGQTLQPDAIDVSRDFQTFTIKTNDNTRDGIYFVQLNYVLKEHVTIFNDRSVFNDLIFDKTTGYRQDRIKSQGFRTVDWDGDYTSPGFVFDNVNIQTWQPFTDYNLGDIVRYKSFNWVSLTNQIGQENFAESFWEKLDTEPEKQLISNFDYQISSFEDYFDVNSTGLNANQKLLARHTIGYQPRKYLEAIAEDPVTQFKLYQGFIKEKGTLNSIEKLFDKLSSYNASGSIEINEEWAVKTGKYGGVDQTTEYEINLDKSEFVLDPQPISFTSNIPDQNDNIYRIRQNSFTISEQPFSFDFIPTVLDAPPKTAGYVKLDQIQFTVKTRDDILAENITNYTENDSIWITFDGPSWSVLRFNQNPILDVQQLSVGDTSVQLFFDRPHDYSVNDIVGFNNIFDLTGFHKISDTTKLSITVPLPDGAEPLLDESTATPISEFTEIRISDYDSFNPEDGALLPQNSNLFVDNNGNNEWEVIKKNKVYSSIEIADFGVTDPTKLGTKVLYIDSKKQTLASIPPNGIVISYIESAGSLRLKQILEPESAFANKMTGSFGKAMAVSPDEKWLVVGSPEASGINSPYQGNFDPAENYLAGDIVLHDGVLWKAKFNVNGDGSTINVYSQDWELANKIEAFGTATHPGEQLQGAITIFEYRNQQWELEDTLVSPRPSPNEKFGSALALGVSNGTYYLAVAAEGARQNTGRVYLFVYNGTEWRHYENLNYRGIYDSDPGSFYPTGSIVWHQGRFWQSLKDNFGDGSTLKIENDDWSALEGSIATNSLPLQAALEPLVDDSTLDFGILSDGQVAELVKQGDFFGRSLAMSYDASLLVVGAPFSDGQFFLNYKGPWRADYEYTEGDVVKHQDQDGTYSYHILDDKLDQYDSTLRSYNESPDDSPVWTNVGDSTDTPTGKVFIYERNSQGVYRLEQTITSQNVIFDDSATVTIDSGSQFGHDLDIDAAGTKLVVSSPLADFNAKNQGSAYVFVNNRPSAVTNTANGFYVYGTDTGTMGAGLGYYYPLYLDRLLAEAQDDGSNTTLGPGAHVHTFSEYPNVTFYMPNKFMNHGEVTPPGNPILPYESLYGTEFRLLQKLFSYEQYPLEFFGQSVSISPNTGKIVIGANNAQYTRPTRFDSFQTSFDQSRTSFSDVSGFSGAVYVFDLKDDTYFLTEKLTSDTDLSLNESFGFSVDCRNDIIVVGSPDYAIAAPHGVDLAFEGDKTGMVRLFEKDRTVDSWTILAKQQPSVDVEKVKSIQLYDNINDFKIQDIEILDHAKLKIFNSAEQELSFKTAYDPAIYSVGIDQTVVDPQIAWTDKNVGKLWWDLSKAKWLYYEQGDLSYKTGNWNRQAFGSEIVILEWVESKLLPSEWAELADTTEGLAQGISGQPLYSDDSVYSQKQIFNPITNLQTETLYYYWVANSTVLPSMSNRRISAASVRRLIENPDRSNVTYASLTGSDQMLAFNFADAINTDTVSINFQFYKNQDIRQNPVHNEYQLISEGLSTSLPAEKIERKWIDSLVGYSENGLRVPDENLPVKNRYGIEFRPRQSMFEDRFEALKIVVNRINRTLTTQPFASTINFSNLNLQDEIPSPLFNFYDLTVDTIEDLQNVGTIRISQAQLQANIVDGELDTVDIVNPGFGYRFVPSLELEGDGTDAEIQLTLDNQGRVATATVVNRGKNYTNISINVRRFSVLVESDSSADGLWSIYAWDEQRQSYFRSRSQAFDTTRYWTFADWWKQGYAPTDRIAKEVQTTAQVPSVDIEIGQLLRIEEYGSGSWAVFEKQSDTFTNILDNYELVGRYQGTIQLSANIYDTTLTGIGFDETIAYDADFYDVENSQEVRNILRAVKEDIYTGSLSSEWNNLFFSSIRYVLQEQTYADWIFKSSFLKAVHNVGSLEQKTNYKNDNLESFIEYIEEVKPYRTSIREFVSKYNNIDNSQTAVTDFDLPAYYDTAEGKVIPVDRFNDKLDAYPWKFYADNAGYSVTEILVTNPGSGYVRPPNVIIEGTGTGAQAQAYISNGSVTSVLVTNQGQGYITSPSILLVGGNDNPENIAKANAVLGRSKFRNFNLGLKFDRISKEGIYNSFTYSQTFETDGITALFDLNYAPTVDKSKIQVFLDNILILDSDYSITLYSKNLNQNNIIRGRILFNAVPASGSTIRIEYSINDELLDAVNRINKYYAPESGMKGKELEQLMTGIDFGGVKIQGTTFDVTGGWDALPWFTDNWDSVESAGDFYVVVDGSTTSVTLPSIPADGQEINIYLKRAEVLQGEEPETVRIDDPNIGPGGDSSQVTNPFAVIPTFFGDGSTSIVEIGDYISIEDGDTLIFRNVESDGSVVINDANLLDTRISGGSLSSIEGAYVTATGLNADDISIDGGTYNNPDFTPAPEENVPGQVLDSLNFKVFQKSSSGSTPVVTNTYKVDGNQQIFPIGQTVVENNSIIVYIDKELKEINTDYTIDYIDKTINLTAAPLENSIVEIISIGIGGFNLLDFKEFSGDGETTQFLTSANYADTVSIVTTVNGINIDSSFIDSSELLDVTGKTLVQFINAPEILDSVKIFVLGQGADTDTEQSSLITINRQNYVYDNTRAFNIDGFVDLNRNSSLGSIIVEVNDRALRGVDTVFAEYNGSNNSFEIGVDPSEPPGTVLPGNISVYLNGTELVFIQDYVYNGTTKILTIEEEILSVGDEIKIENSFRAEYSINANNLTIDSLVQINQGDEIVITWFTEYPSNKFITDQYQGGQVKYKLQGQPVSVDFVWVYLDGEKLTQDHDYYLSDDGRNIYLKIQTTESQSIRIFAFGNDIYRLPRAYQIYKDMLNEYYFYRYSKKEVFLASDLAYYDQTITVSDGSLLTNPVPEKNQPGIIELGNEKIQYFKKDGNVLSQLRRGALGSSIPTLHSSGIKLANVSQDQRIPYTETQDRIDFVGDGSSILIGPLDFTPVKTEINNWYRETIPTEYGQCDMIEIFVGGRRLNKTFRRIYDQQLHATSPEGDKNVEAEFSVNGQEPFIRLTEAAEAGQRITIIRKQGSVWYDRGTNLASAGITFFDNENAIASFIASKTTDTPE